MIESAENKEYIYAGGKGWITAEWGGDMQEAIQRVRKLHEEIAPNYTSLKTMCAECFTRYPCKTIEILNGNSNE